MSKEEKENHNHIHQQKMQVAGCGKRHCDEDHNKQTELSNIKAKGSELLTTFKVSNMDCADEIKAIDEALKVKGVIKVQANLMSSTVQVLHDSQIDSKEIKRKIESTVVKVVNEDTDGKKSSNRNRIILISLSGLSLLVGLILEWTGNEGIISNVCLFLSIVLAGVLVFPKAFGSLKRKSLDMNVLMAVAVIGAIAIKEYSEGAAVVFLFSFSELLESLSVQRARRAIQELLKIAPQRALRVNDDGSMEEVDISELQISQTIRVKAGESIPVDGVVKIGHSTVNQAPLTGESLPVVKTLGEQVYAGTINQEGSLDITVEKAFTDTKLAQVIRLVEEAQSQRADTQKFVDKFSKIYTPVVLAIAVLTFLVPPLLFGGSWHDWLYKALVMLVIACPCALVISTPISIVSGLTALAKRGVLVKGGSVLETLGKIKALAVDKTGTLTEGKLKVEKIVLMATLNEDQVLEIAKALEGHSTHPIAVAIVEQANQRNIASKSVEKFANVTGRGVEAVIEGHTYLLGNHRFAHDVGICTPELEQILHTLEEQTFSVVVVGHKPHESCEGEALGIIALRDTIRADSKSALLEIKKVGVEKIILLSGDNQKTVSAVGSQLPLDEYTGDLLPEDKVSHIERLKSQYQAVAMIGDGINDAPAMAKSSLGIAMGFVGSDTAIETSDVTLMTDDLKQVAVAILLGRRTLKIIQFNIGFALLTKAIFLVLTLAGYSNLWLAVAADTGASLLVILNALRLLKINSVTGK
ncbi:MAG: heavy metal translocating P-type ATPase [Pseudobdellovibrio sp.]